jgi:CRP/FNR family transcriptional regulator, nitrogen fixation regulation protein
MMAEELRHAVNHLLPLGRKNALERVANFLLERDRRRLTVAGMMALPMSRRDIGDYLGLTMVSRSISHLLKDGILGVSGARHFQVLNRAKLSRLDLNYSATIRMRGARQSR